MGTRSLTRIYDYDGDEICCIYKQYDGYPDGYGKELFDFIQSGKLVNGIPLGTKDKVFNGMGCFAAQLICHFKEELSGGYYIEKPGTKGMGEEFVYCIKPTGDLMNPGTIELFLQTRNNKLKKFTDLYDKEGKEK